MRGFADCPPEIISAFWELVVSPEDIKNFALVSKAIYGVAGPFIEQHHILRKKYLSYAYDPKFPNNMPATLLKDIQMNPHVALYVEKLFIQDYVTEFNGDVWQTPREDSVSWDEGYPEENLELFRQQIRSSVFVPSEKAPYWIGHLNEGDEATIIALLLTLLPNLQTLLINNAEDDYILGTVSRLVNDPGAELLSKLTRVELNYDSSVPHQDMHSVALFARLPSIQTITGTGIISTDSEGTIHKDLLVPYKSSGLEELSFGLCGISTKDLFDLLEGIKALKKFEYTCPRGVYKQQEYSSDPFDPFLIRAALLSHARHSLESLTLFQTNGTQTYVGNLQMFKALKILCIEYDRRHRIEEENPTKFLDTLPTSIEKIELFGVNSGCTIHLDNFIPCLLEAKTLRLTKLNELCYETQTYENFTQLIGCHRERVNELSIACEQKGVSFEIGGPSKPSD
ncbi:hypothetical protein MMC28_003953 [Mycoblastus sanguinarius]|nr:hypothetical protein [Mycoblastus sanguinarius]